MSAFDLSLCFRMISDLKFNGLGAKHQAKWDGATRHNYIILSGPGGQGDAAMGMAMVEGIFPGSLLVKGGAFERDGKPRWECLLCLDPTREQLSRAARDST